MTQLALLIDTPKSHVSAILNGRRGVGDQLAGKIERRMGKRLGWLDEPHTETGDIFDPALPCIAEVLDVSDQGWNMLVDFEQLPPAKRAEIAAMVQDEASQWRKLAAEVLKTYTPLGQPGAPVLPPQVRPAEEHTHRVVRLPDDVAPELLRLPHTRIPDPE